LKRRVVLNFGLSHIHLNCHFLGLSGSVKVTKFIAEESGIFQAGSCWWPDQPTAFYREKLCCRHVVLLGLIFSSAGSGTVHYS